MKIYRYTYPFSVSIKLSTTDNYIQYYFSICNFFFLLINYTNYIKVSLFLLWTAFKMASNFFLWSHVLIYHVISLKILFFIRNVPRLRHLQLSSNHQHINCSHLHITLNPKHLPPLLLLQCSDETVLNILHLHLQTSATKLQCLCSDRRDRWKKKPLFFLFLSLSSPFHPYSQHCSPNG